MEDQVEDLKQKVEELTAELKMTKSQLVQARVQQEALVSALRSERNLRKRRSTESSRNSAEIDDLMEKSEKLADVDGLRGKIYQLLPRQRSNSKGKMAGLNESENEDNKTLWSGRVDIAEHSDGADRMRSSNLVRRISQEKQSPRTSTPVSNHGSPRPLLDESQRDVTEKELEESDDVGKENSNSADNVLAEEEDTIERIINNHQGVLRNVSSREPKKHTSKRDSGISVDASPTPST